MSNIGYKISNHNSGESPLSAKIVRVTTVGFTMNVLLKEQLIALDKVYKLIVVASNDHHLEKLSKNTSLNIHPIKMERSISIFSDIMALCRLIIFLRREKPSIIHSSTSKCSIISMLGGFLARVPIRIYTVTGVRYQTEKGVRRGFLRFIEKVTTYFATDVNVEGPSVKNFFYQQKITNKSLAIIGYGSLCGVNFQKFSKKNLDKDKLENVKQIIKYNPSDYHFLAIGRMVKDKGIENLVEAFIKFKKSKTNTYKLILLGPFEKEIDVISDKTKRQIEAYDNIIHIDWADEVEYFLAVVDVLIHASLREGFPNVILEAGAIGCPIICTNIPGNIDIVRDHKTGLLFEAKNTSDLIAKIHFSVNNPEKMNIYAKNLKNEIFKKYQREFIHSEIIKYYQNLLSENNQ